jgi:hypothetical protein
LAVAIIAGAAGPAESILRSRFRELGLNCDFIETLQYVGIQNTHQSSDFRSLLLNVKKLLLNKQCRAPREPAMILKALKVGSQCSFDRVNCAVA